MFLKYLKQFIVKNWPIKAMCLVAAGVLWIYVASSQNTVAKFPGSLRIRPVNVPSNLVAIYDTKTVEIKVMAEPTVWQKLSADAFLATIDLSGMSVGTHEVSVNVSTSISGVQIIQKTPERILVTLEPVISKDVSVGKRIEGNAADGMVPGSIAFSPDKVRIKGAQSVIDNINEAVATIVLNGESEDFKRNISLAVYDDKNQEISDVEIWPSEVEAQVSIVKGSNVKTVGVKVKVSGTVAENYYISDISSSPGAVDISGLQTTVQETKFIETYPVDVSGQNGSIQRDILLNVPDGVNLMGNDAGKVSVTISISPFTLSKKFTVNNFKIENSGSSQVNLSSAGIDLTCEGLPSIIGTVVPSDFAVKVDLNKKQSDGNGNTYIYLTSDDIIAPGGISIKAIEPEYLQITVK